MATVFNNIVKVAGDPQTAAVKIELLWDTDDSPVAKIIDDETTVEGSYQFDTDETGHWSIVLVANDDVDPADNVYRVTETVKRTSQATVYYMYVPDNATPTFWLGSILVSKPSWVS